METKKRLAALGVAALVGVAGYGVYATTLNVASTTAFAAGATQQKQVEKFGTVDLTTPPPTFGKVDYDPKTAGTGYNFDSIDITPKDANWSAVAGSKVVVIGLDKAGNPVVEGTTETPDEGTNALSVRLSLGQANDVVTWSVVIQK
jgi:hypothetical protein